MQSAEEFLLKKLEDTKHLWKSSGQKVQEFKDLEYSELQKLRDLFEVYLRSKVKVKHGE